MQSRVVPATPSTTSTHSGRASKKDTKTWSKDAVSAPPRSNLCEVPPSSFSWHTIQIRAFILHQVSKRFSGGSQIFQWVTQAERWIFIMFAPHVNWRNLISLGFMSHREWYDISVEWVKFYILQLTHERQGLSTVTCALKGNNILNLLRG